MHRIKKNCSYCRKKGHLIEDCFERKNNIKKSDENHTLVEPVASTSVFCCDSQILNPKKFSEIRKKCFDSERENINNSHENLINRNISNPVSIILKNSDIFANNDFKIKRKKYVNMKMNILIDKVSHYFIVDTGADVSLIQRNCLRPETLCNPNEKLLIQGISQDNIKTLATTTGTIFLSRFESIDHKFHVINNELNIGCSGIIGHDFLEKFKCSVDYGIDILKFKINNKSFSFDLCASKINQNQIMAITRSMTNPSNSSFDSNHSNSNLDSILNFNSNDLENSSITYSKVKIKNKNQSNIIEVNDLKEINQILHNFHKSPLGTHMSVSKTINTIKKLYKFTNMISKVQKFIQKCPQCQKIKHRKK